MDLSLSDLQSVAGIMIVVAILVQVIKKDVPEERVSLAALGLGIALAVAAVAALGRVEAAPIAEAALKGILGGAAAVGLYDVQKPIGWLKPKG